MLNNNCDQIFVSHVDRTKENQISPDNKFVYKIL